MRRAAVFLALAAAAACNNKPSGFGVDVEARTDKLPAAVQKSIVAARLYVSGDETFSRDIPNAGKAAQSGAMKFRYVPGVHSGTITIRVDGLDGGGATVAAGMSQPLKLADGKAVDAVFFLATNGNGVPCMAASDCISNNCVDGVCCESACDGVCETCNLPGQPGVCSPQPMGTDPDGECAAKIPPVNGTDDGGTGGDADGGTSGGGIMVTVDPSKCAGTCNGMRACTYPDASTSCGDNFCAQVATVGRFACDGNGACNENDTMCTDYVCSTGACKTSCTSDADCQPTDFCNLNINQCVSKHVLGQACAGADQCASGFCANAVCCDSACNDPSGVQSCNNSGNFGHCQCTGVTCDPGVSCVLWYEDSDHDTYGDATGTIGAGTAKAGCASGTNSTPPTTPTPFVTNNKDCNDHDANANPAQTGWFSMPSAGTGSYDYNCDGSVEKETAEIAGGTCGYCGTGLPLCNTSSTCPMANQQAGYGCFYNILLRHCTLGPATAIVESNPPPNDCGMTMPTVTCGTCPVAASTATTFAGSVTQRCH